MVCISDMQLEDNDLNSALPLIYHFIPTLHSFFTYLYFSRAVFGPPDVSGSMCVYSTRRIEQTALLFQPFCPVLVLFSWIVVMRLLHCVVLECLWNSWWTTEKYRWKSVLFYKGDFKSSSQYCPCYNSCKCLSWWPNPYGEKINCWFWFFCFLFSPFESILLLSVTLNESCIMLVKTDHYSANARPGPPLQKCGCLSCLTRCWIVNFNKTVCN